MRLLSALSLFAMAVPLAAQTAAAPAVAEPVTPADAWLSGWIDIGYQWNSGVAGSFDTYRSVVNLGSGPKLTGTDFTILDPKHRLFDVLHVQAADWGDDPYSTFHLDARKGKLYRFSADYRKLAYFNNLPSFADPLLSRGTVLDEQSFDTHRRLGSYQLDLIPLSRISPYLSYDDDSRSGSGVATFHSDANEYPVATRLDDLTHLFRAGVHIRGTRFHVTVEQGGLILKNDQNTYSTATSNGNLNRPYLGTPLFLAGLLNDYGIRGSSVYTKVLATATPFSWLDIYGNYIYSKPETTINYKQYSTGSFVVQDELLFYSSEQYLVSGSADLPHRTATVGWELRPFRHLRIQQSVLTDRQSGSGASNQNDVVTATSGSSESTAALLASTLETHYSYADTSVIADLPGHVTLRGSHRYVWGDANDMVTPQDGLYTLEKDKMRRQSGSGAVSWRPNTKLFFTAEAEMASSGGTYFRTSLYNYRKVRSMARYQVAKSLQVSVDYRLLSNKNPLAGSGYKYLAHEESASLTWTARKNVDFEGTYEHCAYHSVISFLDPGTLTPSTSVDREYCHTITGLASATLKGIRKRPIHLSGGGAVVLTSGSRPTSFYQPTGKVQIPVTASVALFGDWKYYGLSETYYQYESFRSHVLTVGLRFSK